MTTSRERSGPATGVWFPRAREVELRQESLPALGAEDVQVRAVVSGISHGTEMLVYRGQVPAELPLDLPTLRGSFRFPIKFGYASVGQVIARGSAVASPLEGDMVFVLHPHQTEYVVPAAQATPLPAGLDPALGVFLANADTAVNVLLDAAPRLGERVVVFGQGTVGLLVTQLARRAGASLVVAVDPIESRRAMAQTVGAHVVMPPSSDLPAAIRELTGGIGADVAIEGSGHPDALALAIESVAVEGTVVVSSWYGTKRVSLDLGGAFHRGRVRLVSSQVGGLTPALQGRWTRERRLSLARDLLPRLSLAPLITHRIGFERAAEAYALVDEHPDEVIQVVLTYDDMPSVSQSAPL